MKNLLMGSKERKRAKASRAGEPPLAVPQGGGAAKTPYPDFDVATEDKWNFDWDEKTRKLVLNRVRNVPEYRFFSPDEVRTLEALCALAMPQDDRAPGDRVQIAPWIDRRLYKGE